MVTGILGLQYAAWTTIPSRSSALPVPVLICWAVSIWLTTYWVDNTVRCACLRERSRTPLSSASATVSASVSSLASLPASPPVSPSRLNSVEHLVGWTTTPCFGKDFFPPSGGFAFGAGLFRIVGFGFAIAFAILITAGQIFAYSRGMRPATDYAASRRPRLTRRQFWGTVIRTVGYTVTALICSAFIHHLDHAWLFAIRVGLVTGIVTGVGITVNPYIEYYADNLPERRLGVFGIALILCGFSLQSLQYWLSLFDVRLT
jgi:hypothetical protein